MDQHNRTDHHDPDGYHAFGVAEWKPLPGSLYEHVRWDADRTDHWGDPDGQQGPTGRERGQPVEGVRRCEPDGDLLVEWLQAQRWSRGCQWRGQLLLCCGR